MTLKQYWRLRLLALAEAINQPGLTNEEFLRLSVGIHSARGQVSDRFWRSVRPQIVKAYSPQQARSN